MSDEQGMRRPGTRAAGAAASAAIIRYGAGAPRAAMHRADTKTRKIEKSDAI